MMKKVLPVLAGAAFAQAASAQSNVAMFGISFQIETGILPDTGESLGQSFGIGFWNRQTTVERS